jgi:hypothetical protein
LERGTIEQRILEVMRFWAMGATNAKSREKLLEKINDGVPEDEKLEDRGFRKIYSEMATTNLLGSHPEIGYFVITCKSDLELALNSLDQKAEAIAVRKNMLFSTYETKYGTTDRQRDLAI